MSKSLQQKITAYCELHQNKANVEKYSRFFKHEYKAWGLTAPQMHEGVKIIFKEYSPNINEAFSVLPELFKKGLYDEIGIAILLIEKSHKQFDKSTLEKIGNLFAYGIDNWAHADTIGMMIIPKLMKKKLITPEDLFPWTQSEYKFQRRTALVGILRSFKQFDDIKPLCSFAESLITDSEREVHQGVGWFLREAWVIEHEYVEGILLKWKDVAPRLIIQYATEKMKPEEKLKFKKSKPLQQ